MIRENHPAPDICESYAASLGAVIRDFDWRPVYEMAEALQECWASGNRVFICGNGGSAANANHIANDLLYGVCPDSGEGVRIEALASNVSVLTCLANDVGYAEIFAYQLAVKMEAEDILITLSGSGNSLNILRALEQASKTGAQSFAILGYDGGRAKDYADAVIHFPVHDMQISEDLQLIVAHMVMKWLNAAKKRGAPNVD